MSKIGVCLILLYVTLCTCECVPQKDTSSVYTFTAGDPNGIGKWYMGREIARVMGFHGIDWLERSNRDEEENTDKLLMNMQIKSTSNVADIGAGSGYHVFRMAGLADKAKVYAVDIQDEMLSELQKRKASLDASNVEIVKGDERSVNLPGNSVDKILMVDVYHEFEYPREMMQSIHDALRPEGKLYLIEYRKEDDWVPIKEIHKMTKKQAVKEMTAAGFLLEKNIGNLPWQHCLVFSKIKSQN